MFTLLTTLLIFLASLVIVMSASAWFTRRLEALCDRLDLSPGVLSVLGALGANIPNYVASIDAIARKQTDIGLGIIIGSNIFNVAIILGIASLAATGRAGIRLRRAESRDARTVGYYTLMVLLSTTLLVWLLPGIAASQGGTSSIIGEALRVALSLVCLGLFSALVFHIAGRSHVPHVANSEPDVRLVTKQDELYRLPVKKGASNSLTRLSGEIVLALSLALGGVIVLVQAGQALTTDLHMPEVLAGLLVLAVATSLPNMVVVVILARTGRAAACVEEIFSSNSVNAVLGIALPLLFWQITQVDQLLIVLDTPLMVALVLVALLCVLNGKVSRVAGFLFLLSYAGWVVVHILW